MRLDSRNFNEIFRSLLKEKHRTIDQLGRITNIPKSTLQGWTETTKNPSNLDQILDVCKALNCSSKEVDRLLAPTRHIALVEIIENAAESGDVNLLAKIRRWQEELYPTHASTEDSPNSSLYQARRYPPLIGQDSLIKQALFEIDKGCSILVLHGLGGVGKSHIASHLAEQLKYDFPDGVLWINLELAKNQHGFDDHVISSGLASCITAFGRPIEGIKTKDALYSTFIETIADKKVLLIGDHAHETTDASYFLPPSNGSTLIVTTRNSRVLENEKACKLSVRSLDNDSGIDLFQANYGKRLTQKDKEPAEEIVSFLGGLPLAIKIVAGDLNNLGESVSVKMYADVLKNEAEQLKLLRSWSDSDQNVRATFELSYQHLDEATQQLFAFLSYGDGPDLSTDAITSIMTEESALFTQKRLAHLRAQSLISLTHHSISAGLTNGDLRYQMHPLMRVFAREKLSNMLPAPNMEKKFVYFFSQMTQENQSNQLFQTLELDWPNIHKAMLQAEESNDWDSFKQIVAGTTHVRLGAAGFLDASGRWQIAAEQLEKTVSILSEEEKFSPLGAQLFLSLGAFFTRLHQLNKAHSYLNDGLEIASGLEDSNKKALITAQLYEWLAQISTEKEEALDYTEKGVQTLEENNAPEALLEKGYLLIRHGTTLARVLGDLQQAQNYLEAGIEQLQDYPSSALISGLIGLGNIFYLQGDSKRALTVWEQGIELAEEIGDKRRTLGLRQNKAILLTEKGNFREAVYEQELLLEDYKKMGDVKRAIMMHCNLAEDYTFLEMFDKVLEHLGEAQKRANIKTLPEATVRISLNHAQLALWQNQQSLAAKHLQQAKQLNRDAQLHELDRESQRLTLWLYLLQEEFEEVLSLGDSLLEQADGVEKGKIHRLMGQAATFQNEELAAIYHLEKSVEMFENENSPFEAALTHEALWNAYRAFQRMKSAQEHREKAVAIFQMLDLDMHKNRMLVD